MRQRYWDEFGADAHALELAQAVPVFGLAEAVSEHIPRIPRQITVVQNRTGGGLRMREVAVAFCRPTAVQLLPPEGVEHEVRAGLPDLLQQDFDPTGLERIVLVEMRDEIAFDQLERLVPRRGAGYQPAIDRVSRIWPS